MLKASSCRMYKSFSNLSITLLRNNLNVKGKVYFRIIIKINTRMRADELGVA